MPWRNDSFAKVMYILGGSGRLCLEDREVLLGEEQLCIVPAGCRHRLVDDQEKPVWLLGLCLDQSNPAWSGVVGDLFEKPEVLTNPGLVQEAAMGLKRLLYEQSSKKRGWGEMQVACCAILLVKLLRGRAETGELKSIDRVRWYAEEMASSFYLNEFKSSDFGFCSSHYALLKCQCCSLYLAHVIEQPNFQIPNPQYLQPNFVTQKNVFRKKINKKVNKQIIQNSEN